MTKEKIDKVILAYSGGLDTSVILRWLKETYACEVVCFAADVGQAEELGGLEEKAMATRITAQEEQTKQQIGAVSGAVTGVKTDVGKVRDDVNATRSDLEATKSRLEHAVGDLNNDSISNILDLQLEVNEALGVAPCTDDIKQDGVCNVLDVQRVVNAALGGACIVGP